MQLTIRCGGTADAVWLLGLFDEAVAWLVARGQSGQWGSEPWSQNPRAAARVAGMLRSGGLRVAALDGEDVAALVVGDRPEHVPAADEHELYILLLLVSRKHARRRIGERLVGEALEEARAAGARLLRVDCWAGAPTLVAWYERQGFVRSGTFEVSDGWRGQIFTMELR